MLHGRRLRCSVFSLLLLLVFVVVSAAVPPRAKAQVCVRSGVDKSGKTTRGLVQDRRYNRMQVISTSWHRRLGDCEKWIRSTLH